MTTRKQHFLQPSWGASVGGSLTYRFAAVEHHIRDKDVLDLGAANGHGRTDWIHGHLASTARAVIGVDLDAEAVAAARADGFNLIQGNAETVRLEQQFDVVFAGEIIEHLVNFRGLFETARHHLRPGGLLLLTTPNAFTFTNFVYRVGGTPRVNSDHTCWFCEDTLRQLVQKCDFEVVEMTYLRHRSPIRWRELVGNGVRRMLPDKLAWRTLAAVTRPRQD